MNELQKLFLAQTRFFESGATHALAFRKNSLRRLKQLVTENEAALREALKKDLHKHEFEADAGEIVPVLEEIENAIQNLPEWIRPRPVFTPFWRHNHLFAQAAQEYRPRGTSLILSPWNYPIYLSLIPLVGSISAGNCCILKPSEESAATSELLQNLIRKYFSPEYLSVELGDARLAAELTQMPFDKIFFTGSTATGKKVMAAAAQNLSDLSLELGGKSPAVFDETGIDEELVKRLLWAKSFNAGQTCVAPDFVVIPETEWPKFREIAARILQNFFPSDKDFQESSSKIINQRHFERLKKYLEETPPVVGGKIFEEQRQIMPGLVGPVAWSHRLMAEEIFGPILPVLTYRDLAEVFSRLRQQPNPLAFYVFSRRGDFFEKIERNTKSGSLVWNDCLVQLSHPGLSFGGVKESGHGRYRGHQSFECFSYSRSMEKKPFWPRLSLRYPPYKRALPKFLRPFI